MCAIQYRNYQRQKQSVSYSVLNFCKLKAKSALVSIKPTQVNQWNFYFRKETSIELAKIFVKEATIPRVKVENIPCSRQKRAKSKFCFRPQRLKNHSLWRATYLKVLHKGAPTR